jgi:beta-barrel assembly-enhancing protease
MSGLTHSSQHAFTARLYAAHMPSAGVVVQARFFGESLHIDAHPELQIPCAQVQADASGFDGQTLSLSWLRGDGRMALQPVDAVAQAALLAAAPATLQPALKNWRRGVRRQSRRWLTLKLAVAAAFIAVLLALAAFALSFGALVDWLAERVSPELEAQLGASSFAQLRAEHGLIEQGPLVDAVSTIGGRLTAGSRYRYHWAVKDDPSINAFALPGGYVVVHRGLIAAAASADELAGVLAHEVQHVERRHSLKGMIHDAGWAAALNLVLGNASGVASSLIYQAGALSYSRDLEREADHYGVMALVAADIDPAGLVRFFRTLMAQAPETVALLSSHPASAERIAAAEHEIAALSPGHVYLPLAIAWPPTAVPAQ